VPAGRSTANRSSASRPGIAGQTASAAGRLGPRGRGRFQRPPAPPRSRRGNPNHPGADAQRVCLLSPPLLLRIRRGRVCRKRRHPPRRGHSSAGGHRHRRAAGGAARGAESQGRRNGRPRPAGHRARAAPRAGRTGAGAGNHSFPLSANGVGPPRGGRQDGPGGKPGGRRGPVHGAGGLPRGLQGGRPARGRGRQRAVGHRQDAAWAAGADPAGQRVSLQRGGHLLPGHKAARPAGGDRGTGSVDFGKPHRRPARRRRSHAPAVEPVAQMRAVLAGAGVSPG